VVYRKQPDGKVVRRSIEEAKELLAQAGYPGGRDAKTGQPLVLNFDYQLVATGSAKAELDWYARQFSKLGIQMEVRATDYNRFRDKLKKGGVQIFFSGWLADYPDAENFFFLLYGPNATAITDGNGENNANYQNPQYDAAFERMKLLDDGPEKQALIDKMIEITQRDAVWSFGYFPTSAAAYHQWVFNGKPTQITRNHISYLRLDAPLRASKMAAWNVPVWWPLPLLLLIVAALIAPAVWLWRRRDRETAARTLASVE
jgi:ABC-type oligopeptide transport system substrate-binding subunit